MMDEKDAIALTAMAIENTGTVSTETVENGEASINKETFDSMMTAIDSRLSTLNKSVTNLNEGFSDIDKRVNRLEYKEKNYEHCASSSSLYLKELRKDLDSLMRKVDQIDAALSMSKKYRKRRAKLSKD